MRKTFWINRNRSEVGLIKRRLLIFIMIISLVGILSSIALILIGKYMLGITVFIINSVMFYLLWDERKK